MNEVKITRLSELDGLELKQASFCNRAFPDHFHDSYSIAIIEQGVELLCFGKHKLLGHANGVMIANPYEVHAHGFFDGDICRYRAVYLPEDLVLHIQNRHGLFPGKRLWFPAQLLDDCYLFNNIKNFHAQPSPSSADRLFPIVRYLIVNYASERPEPIHSPSAAITDAAGFLKERLPEKLNIEDTALRYGFNKFSFIRRFKKETGLTPGSYLQLYRINKAKQLMGSGMPMVQVALESGFYDQSHFIRYFKKYTGVAPTMYRNNLAQL
jgi:AraC-like DNA-binding protein